MTYKQKLEEILADEIDSVIQKVTALKAEYVKDNPKAQPIGRLSLLRAFNEIIKNLTKAYEVNLYDDMK